MSVSMSRLYTAIPSLFPSGFLYLYILVFYTKKKSWNPSMKGVC